MTILNYYLIKLLSAFLNLIKSHRISMKSNKIIIASVAVIIVGTAYFLLQSITHHPENAALLNEDSVAGKSIELNEAQLKSVNIAEVEEKNFADRREAVGSIDFNQDMTVQVYSSYQGKIITAFSSIGSEVLKGQPLFTIDSPDLAQTESTLISSAAIFSQTSHALARARELLKIKGISQKDFEQSVTDQQTAEGNFKAARNNVRLFGKMESEIDSIIEKKQIDPVLVVPSPISGRVTARNAAPGLFVQPGASPAPYAVSDVSVMWMIAGVTESDSPLLRIGQDVKVKVTAYPNRTFYGKISTIGATIDPNTHRMSVRSEIRDPKHELKPGMLATYIISTGEPEKTPAVPYGAVVREGDGTMTAWVTSDRRKFTARTVKVGLQQDGFDQIIEGLKAGELVATDGALFIDNATTINKQ